MATVRISKELMEEIKRNITAMYEKVYDSTLAPLDPIEQPNIVEYLSAKAIDTTWKGYEHLRSSTPKQWLTTIDRIDVSIRSLGNAMQSVVPELQIRRKDGTKHLLAPNTPVKSVHYHEVDICESDVDTVVLQQIKKFYADKAAFDDKYKKIAKSILQFVEASKSLNDAVKKLPDIRLYLSDKIKARLDEPTERQKRTAKSGSKEAPQLSAEVLQQLAAEGVVASLISND